MCEQAREEIRGVLASEEENEYVELTCYSNVAILENSYVGVPEVLGQIEYPSTIEYEEPDLWASTSFIESDNIEENMRYVVDLLLEDSEPKRELPQVLNPELL